MNRIRVGVIMFSYDVVESAVNDLYGDVAVLLQIREPILRPIWVRFRWEAMRK